jgi:hypothetical protein
MATGLLASLPEEVLEQVCDMIAPADLPTLSILDHSCHDLAASRMNTIAKLAESPFFLRGGLLLGKASGGERPELYLSNLVNDTNLKIIAAAAADGGLSRVEKFFSNRSKISDTGMKAFAKAGAEGAMPELRVMELQWNSVGDDGFAALAGASTDGAFPKLNQLLLSSNRIGDNGLCAFAEAGAAQALRDLETLALCENQIGDAGLEALAHAATAHGAFPKLSKLLLDHNQITDAGADALADAIKSGAFPSIESVHLVGNRCPNDAVMKAIAGRLGGGSTQVQKIMDVSLAVAPS